jgi:hypothetical protein
MPTGTCKFPEHHSGPSAGPPLGLFAAVAAGAVIVAEIHTVVIVLAVVAVLAVLAAGVFMLWHSAHSAPYDAAWDEPEHQATALPAPAAALPAAQHGPVTVQTVHVHTAAADGGTASLDALRAEVTALRAQMAAQLASAPEQHLHLHGASPDAIAALTGRLGAVQPEPDRLAIERED